MVLTKLPSYVMRLLDFLMIYLSACYVILIYSFLYNFSAASYAYGTLSIFSAYSIISVILFLLSLILAVTTLATETAINLGARFFKREISLVPAASLAAIFFIYYVFLKYCYFFIQDTPFFNALLGFYRSWGWAARNNFRLLVLGSSAVALHVCMKKVLKQFEEFISFFRYFTTAMLIITLIVSGAVIAFGKIDNAHEKTSARSAAGSGVKKKNNIILLTCESLRADSMSLYGYYRNTTPHLNELSRDWFVFDRMHAASNYTRGSIASIIEGRYQWGHKKFQSSFFVPPQDAIDNAVLMLRSAGYATYAVKLPCLKEFGYEKSFGYLYPAPKQNDLAEIISLRYGIPFSALWTKIVKNDFKKPFEMIRYFCEKYFTRRDKAYEYREATHEDDLEIVEELLKDAKEPFFLWAHIGYLFQPYNFSRRYRGTFLKGKVDGDFMRQFQFQGNYMPAQQDEIDKLKSLYEEQMLFLDNRIKDFIRFLKDSKIYDNSVLIITADHGQSFSKGYLGHYGLSLNEGVAHIPLIMHMPGQKYGKRIETLASQVDIAPTILELCGIEQPAYMDGVSLLPFVENREIDNPRPIFSMSLRIIKGRIKGGIVAAYKDSYKLIYDLESKRAELYDLAVDPMEENDISGKEKETTRVFKEIVLERIDRNK